jgi:maltoporin
MGPDPFWSFAVGHEVQGLCHAKGVDFAGFYRHSVGWSGKTCPAKPAVSGNLNQFLTTSP